MQEMEVILSEGLRVDVRFGDFLVKTDQPVFAGGDGSAPEPYALFLASLAACAGIYVKVFCQRRNIPEAGIRIRQQMHYDEATRRLARVEIVVELPPEFPEKYRDAVARAAAQCAVKKTMDNPPEFQVTTRPRA